MFRGWEEKTIIDDCYLINMMKYFISFLTLETKSGMKLKLKTIFLDIVSGKYRYFINCHTRPIL